MHDHDVRITVLAVARDPRWAAVAMLSDKKNRTKTVVKVMDKRGKFVQTLMDVTCEAVSLLNRPTSIEIVSNNNGMLRVARVGRNRVKKGKTPASDAKTLADRFAKVVGEHEIHFTLAKGEAMGDFGKKAYSRGVRALKKANDADVPEKLETSAAVC